MSIANASSKRFEYTLPPNSTNSSGLFYTRATKTEELSLLVLATGYALLGLAGLFGNVLVILVVIKNRQMRNSTNLLLVNVGVADFVSVMIITPEYVMVLTLPESISISTLEILMTVLVIRMTLQSFFMGISAITMALLAIERYNALVHPMKIRRRLSKRSAKLAIGVIWLCAFALLIPQAVWLGVLLIHENERIEGLFESFHFIYTIIVFVISIALPLIVIGFCYGRVIVGMYVINNICSQATCHQQDLTQRKKLAKMLLFVTLVFMIGYFPVFVADMYYLVYGVLCSYHVQIAVDFLHHMSPCLNPILYVTYNTNYRVGAKRLLAGCLVRNSTNRDSNRRLDSTQRRSRVNESAEP